MLVADVMTKGPVTIPRGSSIKGALRLLAEHGVTSLPVVDAKGRICGVVSEADLIRETVAPDPRAHASLLPEQAYFPPQTVDEVFSPHAVTVRRHDDLARAVDVMTSTAVKSLPVVDDHDRVVGIVSRSDVVRLLARGDEVIEAELDDLLCSLGHSDWLVDVADGVVEVTGPTDTRDRSLAQLAARTVPGVIEVRIR